MNDERDDGDQKEEMNEPARYVKSEPRHDPNHEKECRQNQKKEVVTLAG
jgi:hypothetical protein